MPLAVSEPTLGPPKDEPHTPTPPSPQAPHVATTPHPSSPRPPTVLCQFRPHAKLTPNPNPNPNQAKLAKMGFMLQQRPVPLDNIYTAAQAQVAYLVSGNVTVM